MSGLPDLSMIAGAQRVLKRPVSVTVRFAKMDGICATLEGPVHYRAGDAILTGMVGETWPVERRKFDERYTSTDSATTGMNGEYVKKPLEVLALRLDKQIEIPMPGGGLLKGEPGDWLLQYGASDYGVVRDDIFRATYDLV